MDCPKRSEMVLHGRIARGFPELLKTPEEKLSVDSYESNTRNLLEPPVPFEPDSKADMVIRNARLFDPDNPAVPLRDVAVCKNVITHVGSAEEIEPFITEKTKLIDAEGNSVLPGFTDSHLHLAVAMEKLYACDVEKVEDFEHFRSVVKAFAQDNGEASVLYVFGLHYYDPPILSPEDCRHQLDEIVADKPLIVFAHDMHTVWANTKALETAELLHPMPPYPHVIEQLELEDKILLGPDQIPSGEFREPEVGSLLTSPVRARFPRPVDRQLDDLRDVCLELAGHGITSVHRMGLGQPSEDLSFLLLMLELDQRGDLPIRISTSFSTIADQQMLEDVYQAYLAREALARARAGEISAEALHEELLDLMKETSKARHGHVEKESRKSGAEEDHPHIEKIKKAFHHLQTNIRGRHVQPHLDRENPHRADDMPEHLGELSKIRLDTVKIFMDGVMEKETAYRCDESPVRGIPEFKQAELNALVELADKLGMQVAAHCIGDASVKSMLDAISRAREKNRELDRQRGHVIPHRIEHIETCRHEDLPRIGKQNVVGSMQPLHERPPVTLWHKKVPKEKWNTAFPWKQALDSGAVLVFGSDWPIVSCDVRRGIRHAVSRTPWYEGATDQSLNLTEALAAYTEAPASTEYSRKIKGKIAPGMLADLVILAGEVRDLQQADSDVAIRMTICNGRVTFDASVEK